MEKKRSSAKEKGSKKKKKDRSNEGEEIPKGEQIIPGGAGGGKSKSKSKKRRSTDRGSVDGSSPDERRDNKDRKDYKCEKGLLSVSKV